MTQPPPGAIVHDKPFDPSQLSSPSDPSFKIVGHVPG